MKDPNRLRIQSGIPFRVALHNKKDSGEAPGVQPATIAQRRRREIIEPTPGPPARAVFA